METQEDQENSGVKRHVTVFYHQVSYQQEEPTAGLALYDKNAQVTRSTKIDVEDYLPFAILSVGIFMPIGIFSLMHSLRVKRAVKRQDLDSALYFSSWAIQHALTAYVTGSILTMITFIAIFIPVFAV